MRHLFLRLLTAGFLASALTQRAAAQNTVTLEGSVKGDGEPLAAAQVTVVNTATHETARATTRANGEFRVIGLFTGQYVVTVRILGFKPASET
ncbi:MAG: putative oar protein, partial [Gemmatimonadetes bacterium]|nr:putative oar protein [Gemmatimonadota bacterium]